MSSLVKAFGIARMGIGVISWVSPPLTTRLFGLDPDSKQPIVAQLFGAREFALGLLTATSSRPALDHVLRIGVAIDAADAVASARQIRAGKFSTQAKVLVAAGAVGFAVIGAVALAGDAPTND